MTQHIIDTDELEKLPTVGYNGYLIKLDDLRALIASSPQADGMVSTEQIREVINTLQQNKVKANSQCMDSAVEVGAFNEALVVAIKLLEAMLSAYKPQADDVPPDVYDIVVDTGDGIYHTAEVVHFQQSGSKRMIQVRFGDTQADDVRKDAERYRWLRHGDNDERVIQHGPVAPDYHWLPRNERLDEMIDNAITIDKARD